MKKVLIIFALVLCSLGGLTQDLDRLEDRRPFSFSSSINVSTTLYRTNRTTARQAPFTYNIYGSPVISVYGISFPFSFRLSNHHRSFQQPLNQFGLSPEYKWVRLHAGYRSIHFSPFTLAGRRILGGGIELNPGKFRFGFVAGKTQQQRLRSLNPEPDSTYFVNQSRPAFDERIYALKLGWGSEKNYIDFHFLRGKEKFTNELDDVPSDNTAFGISYKLNIIKDLISWKTDIGLSAQNRNYRAPGVDLEEIPAGTFVDKIFLPTESSQYLTAIQTELGFKTGGFSLAFSGRRIDPDYRTAGMYYQMTDILEYKLKTSIRMLKNKLLWSGSVGRQENNLNEFRSKTSERLIYNLIANYMPSNSFGIYGSFTNFGITQSPMQRSLSDTTLLEQVNKTILLTPHFTWSSGQSQHSLRLNMSYFDLADRSLFLTNRSDLKTRMGQLQYSNRGRGQPWSFQGGLAYQDQDIAGQRGSRYGGFGGVDYRHLKQLFNAGIRMNVYQNRVNQIKDGTTWNLTIRGSCKITGKIRLNLRYHWLNNQSESELINRTFSESTFNTSLQCTF